MRVGINDICGSEGAKNNFKFRGASKITKAVHIVPDLSFHSRA